MLLYTVITLFSGTERLFIKSRARYYALANGFSHGRRVARWLDAVYLLHPINYDFKNSCWRKYLLSKVCLRRLSVRYFKNFCSFQPGSKLLKIIRILIWILLEKSMILKKVTISNLSYQSDYRIAYGFSFKFKWFNRELTFVKTPSRWFLLIMC